MRAAGYTLLRAKYSGTSCTTCGEHIQAGQIIWQDREGSYGDRQKKSYRHRCCKEPGFPEPGELLAMALPYLREWNELETKTLTVLTERGILDIDSPGFGESHIILCFWPNAWKVKKGRGGQIVSVTLGQYIRREKEGKWHTIEVE